MRLRELAKKGVDVHRLPFQDDILDGKTGRRGSIGAFIESSSLSQSINELRRQVNYLAASKQLENPSERDSGASGTDLPLDCVQWREANSERPPSGRGQTLPPVQQDDKRPKLCRTCSSYHLPSAQCRNIRASS